jgi:thiamine-triphosphatase
MALRLTRALRFTATTTLPKAKPTTAPITRATHHPNPKKKTTTTILEVERKFRRLTLPTLPTTPNANANQQPSFQSVLPLPIRQIHDIYYDTPAHTLCAAGAWIRKRNGNWEAKINNKAAWGGDFVNSRFEEVCGAEAVGVCVTRILGNGGGEGGCCFCRCKR